MSTKSLINTARLLHSIREIPPSVLNSTEKYLLVIILACINTVNDTWQPVENIARFACLSSRSINRHIKGLEKKKFIKVKRPEHYTHKKANHYSLNIKLIESYHVDNPEIVDKSHVNLSPDTQVACQIVTQSHDKLSGDRMTNCRTKGERKNERKRERGETHPIPLDFVLNSKSVELIDSLGLEEDDANTIIDKFCNYYTKNQERSDDWNRMLQIWVNREMEYRAERAEKKRLNEPEERPWYHKETEHMKRGNGLAAIGTVLKNMPNGHGGHTNGLGGERKRKA